MSQHYPSWRYHRNGKAFLAPDPDHEPQGPDWAESPWPPLPVEPKLNPCCAALKAKFDAAWKKLNDEQAQASKDAEAQWQEKVNDCAELVNKCAELQAQLDALKSEPATENAPKPKKK